MKIIKKYFCFKNVMLVSGVSFVIGTFADMIDYVKVGMAFVMFAWVVSYIFLMTKANLLIKDDIKQHKKKDKKDD